MTGKGSSKLTLVRHIFVCVFPTLQYYGREEHGAWRGAHAENGVWNTLFALLMWDVLFLDRPDVFQNEFQTAPLDLDTDFFFCSRKKEIEARLEQVSQSKSIDP